MKAAAGSVRPLRIGSGAGFSGDRWDAAVPVVRSLSEGQGPAVLMYETLAERTLALAQLQRRQDPESGWEPSLERFVRPVLAACIESGIPIVGNFGAANPEGAARRLQALGRELGLPKLRIAVVSGDDLLPSLTPRRLQEVLPQGLGNRELVSGNVYLGACEIADALREGAQIVVTGRVADPALALGPLLAHFGWAMDDWDRLAAGTVAGHLLECGAQVTGGYFADPGSKDVPDLAHVGFPIAEVAGDGSIVIGKPAGTGGRVDRQTVTEQLLYEMHDPAAYLTPDVVVDITGVELAEIAPNRVRVTGVRGNPRPETLKATLCYEGGWLAEGEISYAGVNAAVRARLAGEVVAERLRSVGLGSIPLRRDLIGVASVFGDDAGRWIQSMDLPPAQDVRLRVAAALPARDDAEAVVREVLALYCCGPAGGGGVRTSVTRRLGSQSALVPRDWVQPSWRFLP